MIDTAGKSLRRFQHIAISLGAGFLLASGLVGNAQAAGYQNLAVVKPVMSCEQLAQADLSKIAEARISITSATVRDTDKGPYCSIVGAVEPGMGFRADLPIERWTQRYLQNAQGRYTDFTGRAGGCAPALNGEIAVATVANAAGSALNPPGNRWGMTPDSRINWAYRANHMTAVAVKGLINIFYGQPQKFSYMVGCSEGGRQTLNEAQRFPEDFDGVSVGAPVVYDTTHNVGFWHGWEYHVNQRADDSIILSSERLGILHDAAITHCAKVAGSIDGMLQHPTACKFDKSWVQCAPGVTDTTKCLTAEEARVAEQLYLGPNDGLKEGKGNYYEISGWPLGSELFWRLSSPGKPASGEALNPNGIHRTFMPPLSGLSTPDIMAQFDFTQQWFDKTMEMAPLMNAANTNLRPYAQRGGKMILWVGAQDTIVQPAMPISYYEGVRKEMGARQTDAFMRFYLLPGVGHCGGGEGPNQTDILSPLMAWVEMNQEPQVLVAGRPVPVAPVTPPQAGQTPAPQAPYAALPRPTVYTRPIYPYPYVAKFTGKGDVNDAANYARVKASLKVPQVFQNQTTAKLLGPNNQKFYRADGDNLVVEPKK